MFNTPSSHLKKYPDAIWVLLLLHETDAFTTVVIKPPEANVIWLFYLSVRSYLLHTFILNLNLLKMMNKQQS